MILKLAGSKSVRDFTLLGEAFSVEIEHIPEEELTKSKGAGDSDIYPEHLPIAIPSPETIEGCCYRRAFNGCLKDPQWKRATLSDMYGKAFMVVDFCGTAYVMNDSGKTIDAVH